MTSWYLYCKELMWQQSISLKVSTSVLLWVIGFIFLLHTTENRRCLTSQVHECSFWTSLEVETKKNMYTSCHPERNFRSFFALLKHFAFSQETLNSEQTKIMTLNCCRLYLLWFHFQTLTKIGKHFYVNIPYLLRQWEKTPSPNCQYRTICTGELFIAFYIKKLDSPHPSKIVVR